MKIAFSVTTHTEGQLDVTLRPPTKDHPTGRVQIYPAGIIGPCLFMSPEDWRRLNTAVEEQLTTLADSGKMAGHDEEAK